MSARSTRAEVRNPILTLPSIRAMQALDPNSRAVLAVLLYDLQRDARARAEKSWDTRKPPLAAYWAAVAVYAGHIARCLRPNRRSRTKLPMIIKQCGHPDLPARDWADASRRYSSRREASGLGASGFPEAAIHLDDVPVARISYNGRIWPLGSWGPDTQPIYDNRVSPSEHHPANRGVVEARLHPHMQQR